MPTKTSSSSSFPFNFSDFFFHMRSKRRTMAKKSTLPNDTIKNILSRLPVKSLTRFESVSKPFSALINSPDFISTHLRRSSPKSSILIRRFHNTTACNFTFSFVDTHITVLREVEIPFLNSLICFPKIIGSCNGLVCLDISPCYATGFVMWNIARREFKTLPHPKITNAQRPFWMVSVGFGYDQQISDYKLVRIVNFCQKPDEPPFVRAELYSWRTDSWTVIDRKVTEDGIGPCAINGGQRGVAVNGGLHWVAIGAGNTGNHKFIVSFDMGTEEFRRIQTPDFAAGICVRVMGFKGSLALALYPGYWRPMDRIEMWALDEIGADGKCWTKLHLFQTHSFGLGSPVGVINESGLLMKRGDGNFSHLSLFDPSSQGIKRLHICGADYSCDIHGYVDSLVPVNAGHEAQEEEEDTNNSDA